MYWTYKIDNKSYNYSPKMDPIDFIRNNDVETEEEAIELMILLYQVWLHENYI